MAPPATGFYLVCGILAMAPNAAASQYLLQMAKTGGPLLFGAGGFHPGATVAIGIKHAAKLAANDYIEFLAYQATGSAVNSGGAAGGAVNRASIFRIA